MVLIFVLAIHLRKKDDASCQEKLAALEEEKKKLLSQVEPVQDKGPSRMTDFLEHSISTTMKYARAGAERAIMEVHFDLEVDQDGFCLRVPCYDDEDEYEIYRFKENGYEPLANKEECEKLTEMLGYELLKFLMDNYTRNNGTLPQIESPLERGRMQIMITQSNPRYVPTTKIF